MDTSIKLIDGHVLLRPPRPDDAPSLVAAVRESLIELHPWMDWATDAFDEAAAGRWLQFAQLGWEHSTAFHFAVTDAITGQYMGNCGIDDLNRKSHLGNLGYWVRTSRTRQGIASRAVQLAARFAFEQLELVRVEIVVAAGNVASQRTALKAGAHFEGVRPTPLVVHTDVHSAMVYSLTPPDLHMNAA